MLLIVLCLLAVSQSFVSSTQNKIDSLKQIVKEAKPDTTRAKALNDLAWELKYANPDTSILLSKQALQLYDKLKDLSDEALAQSGKKGTANCYSNLGGFYWIKSDYHTALQYHHKALKIRKALNHKKGIATSYNNIGVIYKNQSDYPNALKYYMKSLRIFESLGGKREMAASYNNIGIIYKNQSDYLNALKYHMKSLRIKELLGDKRDMATSYNNIGIIYDDQSDYPKALKYYMKSLRIMEALGDKQGMSISYISIGNLCSDLYDQDTFIAGLGEWALRKSALLDTALKYQLKALEINKELSNEYYMTYSLSSLGDIYYSLKKYTKAIQYQQQAAALADSIGALHQKFLAYGMLGQCYEKIGKFKTAYGHYMEYATLKDTVFQEEKNKEIGKTEARYEFEMAVWKQEKEAETKAKAELIRIKKRDLVHYSAILVFLLFGSAFVIIFARIHIPEKWINLYVFTMFILLFEFLFLLTDPYIDNWSGGEPAWKVAANVLLAVMLYPLHNIFERMLRQRLFKAKREEVVRRKKIFATKTPRHKGSQR